MKNTITFPPEFVQRVKLMAFNFTASGVKTTIKGLAKRYIEEGLARDEAIMNAQPVAAPSESEVKPELEKEVDPFQPQQ